MLNKEGNTHAVVDGYLVYMGFFARWNIEAPVMLDNGSFTYEPLGSSWFPKRIRRMISEHKAGKRETKQNRLYYKSCSHCFTSAAGKGVLHPRTCRAY